MISIQKMQRRLFAYLFFNAFIVLIALEGFSHVRVESSLAPLKKGVAWYFSSVFRMYISVVFFEWIASTRKRIHEKDSTKGNDCMGAMLRMVFMLGVMDAFQCLYLTTYFDFVDSQTPASRMDFLWQYLAFVPKSLLLELIFDLYHYWAHRMAHRSKWLYRIAHADHHAHSHPGPWTTFEQSFLDALISNMAPLFVTLAVTSQFAPLRLTIWQFHLLLAYKTYTEVGGHSGIDTHAATFPQFPGIFLELGSSMCLTSHDHWEHHRILRGNFSKRFRFWDVAFGTYIETNPKRPAKNSAVFSSAFVLSSSALALACSLQ